MTTIDQATDQTEVKPGDRDPGAVLDAQRYRLPGFTTEVGPVGHLQAERHRLNEMTWEHFTVTPLGATIGAEIGDIDLTGEISDELVAELRRALLEYKVIFFRDQPLDGGQHVALAKRFGELEIHPFISSNDEHPELVRFEKSADVGGYENGWHSDVSWRAEPSMGAMLHAISVPPTGGDTLFADMAAIYDGLSDEARERVDPLIAVHDFTRAFGHTVAKDARDEMRRKYPQVRHPVIRTHPETARRLVYVNRFFVEHIEGLEPEESVALIDELCALTDQPEYQCRFHWTNDSIAFWDNRAVQHYACSDYWPDVRIMERASVIGDAPG